MDVSDLCPINAWHFGNDWTAKKKNIVRDMCDVAHVFFGENYFEGMISFHSHSKFRLPSILIGRKK